MTGRTRQDGEQTRRHILDAAAMLFARNGYESTTIATICHECNVNLALVNYHFKSKENLYRLAWLHARARTSTRYPDDGGVPKDASPEARLRGRIAALLRQNADTTCYDEEIWRKELAHPTGLLNEVRRDLVVPARTAIRQIVQELLGASATAGNADLCTMSVMAQCRVPVGERRQGAGKFLHVDLETRIDHVWRFSLAGIAATGNSTTNTAPVPDGSMATRPR